jgi:hypothetical protein
LNASDQPNNNRPVIAPDLPQPEGLLQGPALAADEADESEPIRVWSGPEVSALFRDQAHMSVLTLLGQQALWSAACAILAASLGGFAWGVALALGAACVLAPSALMAWAVGRRPVQNAHSALLTLAFWQLVKWIVGAALLLITIKAVPDVKVWGLMLGVVVGLKSGTLILLLKRQRLVF